MDASASQRSGRRDNSIWLQPRRQEIRSMIAFGSYVPPPVDAPLHLLLGQFEGHGKWRLSIRKITCLRALPLHTCQHLFTRKRRPCSNVHTLKKRLEKPLVALSEERPFRCTITFYCPKRRVSHEFPKSRLQTDRGRQALRHSGVAFRAEIFSVYFAAKEPSGGSGQLAGLAEKAPACIESTSSALYNSKLRRNSYTKRSQARPQKLACP